MNHAGVFVVAEAGVNHNGNLDLARELIDEAANAGADAVKFQTFRSESVISRNALKADYQLASTGSGETQLEMVRKLELGETAHAALIEHCARRHIQFLSTPFDLASVQLLAERFDLPCLKVPSGEITNLPLLLAVGSSRKRIIMSTGMANLQEVDRALRALAFGRASPAGARPSPRQLEESGPGSEAWRSLESRVVLLHCTTEYPAPFEDVNLRAMDTLAQVFGLPVGYSDHTRGITIAIAAAARGASVIEKHITLDRNLPGPDHQASIEPGELRQMVRMIREVEKALGDGSKRPMPSEMRNIDVARKSLVAACAIARGELFSERNLTTKRPGSGITAMRYFEFLGQAAQHDYAEDQLIDEG